ncbi:ABC transporter ATP-binding protein [Salisediminibacterium selenitireducens]|uniref:ABC transporter related protein n=1 Tax=Bacillus selenitireducens (strain ATCC 700615 / DSM 15326 / MLS10) TaxID=439292 RepID=D6XUN2_BACIE|nr:ABC transporter ATP-binding protein [Salisediminibacterium selenitireducens]ADH99518.1 ABC transporter related protein [[Bacillus] selenitireducens MLS10]
MSLQIERLSKTFAGTNAVNDLSFEIGKGQMFGMLGANGAGKTTSFRMILGLLDPSGGTAKWMGERLSYKRTALVGYLPEERGLFPKLTVKEQMIYLMRLKQMNKTEIVKELRHWLGRFQIEEYENKRVEELSKGNQQKIQFMASVLHNPELLILDEPFSGLDPVNADMLKEAVLDLQKQGTTIVFSSHQMHNVEELCDDLVMLKHGKALLQGNLKDIKRNYGMKSITVEADFPLDFLHEIQGVEQVNETKLGVNAVVESEETAKQIFTEVASRGFARRFTVNDPSLHEIFIDQMGGDRHA